MKIVFRVDSSQQIGSGHLMRCLTLADQLKGIYEIVFISRDLDGNLNSLIRKKNFDLIELTYVKKSENLIGYERWLTVTEEIDAYQTIDLIRNMKDLVYIILDHYAIGEKWEKIIRPYVKKIMVIDDLANRKHDCDVLLDQNFYCNLKVRYQALVPGECKLLLGPQYALLRDRFYELRKARRERGGIVQRILIFFGGSDPTNETMKALRAIIILGRPNIIIDVVVGRSNPNRNEIKLFCEKHKYNYHCQIDYMADLMNEADLSIGAGGTATWERCFSCLPSIVVSIAENQVEICEDCAQAGCIYYLGWKDNISHIDILNSIEHFMKDNVLSAKIQESCSNIMGNYNFENLFANLLMQGETNERILKEE